jgi:crotonobetainyl-CoA:carnitine CoA-transferase CaiB-like acyl-CoA transferase
MGTLTYKVAFITGIAWPLDAYFTLRWPTPAPPTKAPTAACSPDSGCSTCRCGNPAAVLRADLGSAIRSRTRDELVASLRDAGVPIAPVLSRVEMLNHTHFRDRSVITTGPAARRMLGHPIQYAIHPALPRRDAPSLGEHDRIGFDEARQRLGPSSRSE